MALLREALDYAAETARAVSRPRLDRLLTEWLNHRLDVLVRPAVAGETARTLEGRLRRALVLCHRYRQLCTEMFGDGMWRGRPLDRWWCPAEDLAAHASFSEFGEPSAPDYVLWLRRGTVVRGSGTFAVRYAGATPGWRFPFRVDSGEVLLDGEVRLDGEAAAEDHLPPADPYPVPKTGPVVEAIGTGLHALGTA